MHILTVHTTRQLMIMSMLLYPRFIITPTTAALLLLLTVTAASAFTTPSPLLQPPHRQLSSSTSNRASASQSMMMLFAEEEEVKKVTGIITLKLAFDSQWGVSERAAATTTSERFTSPESLDMVHRLRRDSDAVLVGSTTVQNDNPSLTVRRVAVAADYIQPVRVVLDSKLSLDTHAHDYTIFNDGLPTLVYHADTVTENQVDNYVTNNANNNNNQVTCIGVPLLDGRLSLQAIVEDLQSSQRNLHHIMVEGGPTVARAFLQHNLVDRAIVVKAMSVTFQDPYPSGMTDETFSQNGLEYLGQQQQQQQLDNNNGDDDDDGDILQCWSRPNLPWPTDDLEDWP
jgi:riboflavin-specific deaminase-like protein